MVNSSYPPRHDDLVAEPIVVFKFLGSGSGAVLNISVMSALVDVADENQLISGDRQEGILYSARTFFAKVDHALGLFLAGVVLDYIAFPTDAEPGQVAGSVLFRLGMVDGPYLILPGLIAAFSMPAIELTNVVTQKSWQSCEPKHKQ